MDSIKKADISVGFFNRGMRGVISLQALVESPVSSSHGSFY
jgi:hypothetical protein